MKININNQEIHAKIRKSMFSKANGLMLKTKVKRAEVFWFNKPRNHSLHSLLVFTKFDVIGLDKNNKIIEIKKNFKPFTFFKFKKSVYHVIELPPNKFDLKIGQEVKFLK